MVTGVSGEIVTRQDTNALWRDLSLRVRVRVRLGLGPGHDQT